MQPSSQTILEHFNHPQIETSCHLAIIPCDLLLYAPADTQVARTGTWVLGRALEEGKESKGKVSALGSWLRSTQNMSGSWTGRFVLFVSSHSPEWRGDSPVTLQRQCRPPGTCLCKQDWPSTAIPIFLFSSRWHWYILGTEEEHPWDIYAKGSKQPLIYLLYL